jgi:hypothetical protein
MSIGQGTLLIIPGLVVQAFSIRGYSHKPASLVAEVPRRQAHQRRAAQKQNPATQKHLLSSEFLSFSERKVEEKAKLTGNKMHAESPSSKYAQRQPKIAL